MIDKNPSAVLLNVNFNKNNLFLISSNTNNIIKPILITNIQLNNKIERI